MTMGKPFLGRPYNLRHRLRRYLSPVKYEVLLVGLLQHLFIGILLPNLQVYAKYVWPANMVLLVICSAGLFYNVGKVKNRIRFVLSFAVVYLPVIMGTVGFSPVFMQWLSLSYLLFFGYIFFEVLQFLVRPGYINRDIISAAACGYLLLIEVYVFSMQFFFYHNPASFHGIDTSGPSATYIDFVYLGCITITSIGFGDITPAMHQTKLLMSVLGLTGHFYTVILMGILISKFTGASGGSADPQKS
jgi:Ion channel